MTSGKRVKVGRQVTGSRRSTALRALEAERRRRRIWATSLAVGVLAAIGLGIGLFATGSTSDSARSLPKLTLRPLASLGRLHSPGAPGPVGPEGVPVPQTPALATLSSAATGNPVDGIQCQTNEQTIFHIHAHLTIFFDGTAHPVPYGIGIPGAQAQNSASGAFVSTGTCFYWLHTHAADGIIHIESPVHRTYTLGDFFDVWGQKLGPNEAGPARGHVTSFYDGKLYVGNPRDIPLEAHAQIQLDVGRPVVAPVSIKFPSGI